MADDRDFPVTLKYFDAALHAHTLKLAKQMADGFVALEKDLINLRQWTQREIERVEREMLEASKLIVQAIHHQTDAVNHQTIAVVGGVAETTALVQVTKNQIEQDFELTRGKIEIQTESALQVEVGKKIADASALRSKVDAFIADVKERFDKAILGVALNRELYDLNFRKITDEYENKVRTIGAHIFQVKQEDIAPAMKAARVPYEQAHSLPIEMDLLRLSARAQSLDETLAILKSSRLDQVVQSGQALDATLDSYNTRTDMPGADIRLCVQGVATVSPSGVKVLSGHIASRAGPGCELALTQADESLREYVSTTGQAVAAAAISRNASRDPTGQEVMALSTAVAALHSRGLISHDAKALFEDFLGSGNLKCVEV